MTRDEIIHMVEKAGCGWANKGTEPVLIGEAAITTFADIVAAAEREACATLVEKNADVCGPNTMLCDVLRGNAAAIRARGDA